MNNQISGYSYDAAGDLLSDGNGNTYAYSIEGKLATNNGLSYIYDALGQFVSKASSASSEMIYFGGRPISIHLLNGSYLLDLVWAGNNPVAARWLSPDPYNGSYDLSNPQSFNRYMYVGGNPLAFTDPSGLWVGVPYACLAAQFCLQAETDLFLRCPICVGVVAALDAVFQLGDLLGWWGGPSFNGNV